MKSGCSLFTPGVESELKSHVVSSRSERAERVRRHVMRISHHATVGYLTNLIDERVSHPSTTSLISRDLYVPFRIGNAEGYGMNGCLAHLSRPITVRETTMLFVDDCMSAYRLRLRQ